MTTIPSTAISGPMVDAANPWPGLASFSEETQAYFHGRETEVGELNRRVQRKLLTVLFGQSGLGKTSMLRAGVVPRLRREGYCPVYVRIDYSADSPPPAEQIRLALALVIQSAGGTAPATGSCETLWEFLHRRDEPLREGAKRALIPLIIFDQFEEIFTLAQGNESGRERAAAFTEELADVVENRPPQVVEAKLERDETLFDRYDFSRSDYRILISLREDYLPHLEGLKSRMPSVTQNRLRLAQMRGTQALEAVVKPAGPLVTAEVARAIVEFVAGARGGSLERLAELEVEPALLSVICRELNERRRALGQAQITADLVSGNRREILSDFYERSVGDLPELVRLFVEDRLLTKSGFRDNLALETAIEESGVTKTLIDTLVQRRLLRLEDRLGTQRVELTHDVLADVVKASRDARQQRQAMSVTVRAARRQRWTIVGLATAVAVLLVGAFFGIRAQRRAEQSAREEASQASQTDVVLGSRLLDEGKLVEGLGYLVRAGLKDPGNRIVAPRLLTALTARNFLLPADAPLTLPSPAFSAAFTTDGRRLVVQSEDGSLRLIDVPTWKVAREFRFDARIKRGGVTLPSESNAIFAVVLEDNRIVVADLATGRLRFPPIQPADKVAGRIPRFGFSPDGRWLAATGVGETWVWDAATGEIALRIASGYSYREIAFSRDGSRFATPIDSATTRLWTLPGGAPVGDAIRTETAALARFSDDGRRLFVWHRGGISVLDPATAQPLQTPLTLQYNGVNEFWVTPNGDRVVYTGTDRAAHVVDVESGKPAFPPLLHGGNVLQGALIAGGSVLFTNSVDGLCRLWDLTSGKLLVEPTLRQRQYTPATVTQDGQSIALFTPEGEAYRLRTGRGAAEPLVLPRSVPSTLSVNLAVGSPTRLMWVTPAGVRQVDVASGRLAPGGFDFPQPLQAFSRSSYGTTLGAGDIAHVRTTDGEYRVWTLGAAGIAHDCWLAGARPGTSTSTWISSTQNRIVLTDTSNVLGIWDTHSGRRVTEIVAPSPIRQYNSSSWFSPDGKHAVLLTNDDIVRVYDLAAQREHFTLQLTGRAALSCVRYSPDGRHLLTGDTWGGVQVWDATDGTLIRNTQRHRTNVTRFDHSSPGRYYASLSTDGSVQVWDAATHEPIGALMEQSGAAARADFSPENDRIITPSTRGSARIWDVRTGLPLTDPLLADEEPLMVVAFSPDGKFVEAHAFASVRKQSVRVWAAPPPAATRTPAWLLSLATICAGHRLTDDGNLVPTIEALREMRAVNDALAAAPPNDVYAEWARWLLTDDPNRPIGPGFTITPAEARKLREEYARATGIAGAPQAFP